MPAGIYTAKPVEIPANQYKYFYRHQLQILLLNLQPNQSQRIFMEQKRKGTETVPLAVAQDQTANWRTYINSISQNPIYGFYLPLASLQQAAALTEGGVRMYIGLSDDLSTYDAFVVAVDADGNDILTLNGESTIYDSAAACPACCGNPSPLNHPHKPKPKP